jgi:hypothetical protein
MKVRGMKKWGADIMIAAAGGLVRPGVLAACLPRCWMRHHILAVSLSMLNRSDAHQPAPNALRRPELTHARLID